MDETDTPTSTIVAKCRNCGLPNHTQKNCYRPITSYGIILFYVDGHTHQKKYLMICRKHTIGFIQIVRGKYSVYDIEYIQALINVMTNQEILMLQTYDYKQLWEVVWEESWTQSHLRPNQSKSTGYAEEKFLKLRNGEFQNGVSLNTLIQQKSYFYEEPEWGFPKGRPANHNETPLQTALREFSEETMIPLQAIEPIKCNPPYVEECYKSYDNLYYRNIYYIYQLSCSVSYPVLSTNEVSVIQFLSLEDCIRKIRGYYPDKKAMIQKLDTMIRV